MQDKVARLSDEEINISQKKSKLDSSKSQFNKPSRPSFESAAEEAVNKAEDKKQKALELTKQFWNVIRDKTLPENKGPLKKDLEKEISNKLISYAIEINGYVDVTDDDGNILGKEPDGMGSVGLIALLMKTVLYQRDVNNLLEKRLVDLESIIKNEKPTK